MTSDEPRFTRLAFHATPTGDVELRGEGVETFARTAVRKAGSASTALRVAELLNGALREGAAYGPVDDQAELAWLLSKVPAPAGRVWYDLTPAFTITRLEGGRTTTLDVPRLASKRAAVELARELGDAFRSGGEHPHAVPAACGDVQDAGDRVAARVDALAPGQVLLEITRGAVVHLAVESPDGIVCECGRVGENRFKVARLHLPKRSRTMPDVREVAVGA